MPLTDRERELLRLLDPCRRHLQQQLTVDPASVEPFGALDAAVQRWLQLAIQCCLDLGDALLGRLGQPESPRYRGIFAALVRAGVIDAPLAQAMERLADHCNALTHAYLDLTPHETWRWLREGLPARARFCIIRILHVLEVPCRRSSRSHWTKMSTAGYIG